MTGSGDSPGPSRSARTDGGSPARTGTGTGPASETAARSGRTAGSGWTAAVDRALGSRRAVRIAALGGVGLLILSYLSVLHYFIDVTGNPNVLRAEALLAVAAATYFSGSLRARTAALVSGAVLAVGLAVYVFSLPTQPPLVPLIRDALVLATGRSLLQLTNVDLWVLGVAPGPLFLTWYLGLRRRYVSATLVGGGTLGYLVLTSDAGSLTTLLGVVGGAVAVGVGDVERRGETISAAEPLAVMLALMILLSGIATVVPGGPSRTATGLSGIQGGGGGTAEASLVDAGSQIGIGGDISLSPEVRFRVESTGERYWRIGGYDRYTGDGWVRTGGRRGYGGGELERPPGETERVVQNYTALQEVGVLPAAWKPVSMFGESPNDTYLNDAGSLELDGQLAPNQTYAVESRAPAADPGTLRDAGDSYPLSVEDRYTRVPSSTPDRLVRRTERITANADNAYDTARVVERWLENNKNYSLDVDRPEDGNIADAFLFEMDAGYCTYFATTMVTMLRSQDIPARFVVGYAPGERVARDTWVVRGFDAHAWVEVYFPDVGWVRFDPTPATPRRTAEQAELASAREQNRTGVDTNRSGGQEWTPTATATPAPLTPPAEQPGGGQRTVTVPENPVPDELLRGDPNVTAAPQTTIGDVDVPGDGDGDADEGGIDLPSRGEATLIGFVVLGLVLGARRLGLAERAYRAVWVRYQPASDPPTDAERAFDRLEYVLERRYRPRRPGETPRQYLAAIGADERANAVERIWERAHYAGDVTREEADEAVSLVDEIVSG